MSDAMKIHHLTKGLRKSLIDQVVRRQPQTPTDFLTAAKDEEKVKITLDGLSNLSMNATADYPQDDDPIDGTIAVLNRPVNTYRRPAYVPQQQTSVGSTMQTKPVGHYVRQSSPHASHTNYRYPRSPLSSRQCYHCFGFGHIAKYCPNRKNQ
jgi:hypothetical protein